MIKPGAFGIIFANSHDENLPEMLNRRTMASLPFAGRYRMIDFSLSSMARAGIQNVGVIAKQNYQSLMDHLGSGREWDLARKRGGLVIFPPYSRNGSELYSGRVEALASILEFLERRTEGLVVMSDCDTALNMDYRELMARHRASGADISMVYEHAEIPNGMRKDNVVLGLNDEGVVKSMRINEYKKGEHNVFLNIFVADREALITLVREAVVRGEKRFDVDVLSHNIDKIKIMGQHFDGYRARIFDMQSYFSESLRLINPDNLAALFPQERPVYTKVRDEAPVRYAIASKVSQSIVADGCIVEGEVENCVIFRGVRIGKGAKLKNCIIMQGSEIMPGAEMENVIADKNVLIGENQSLRGAAGFPVFIAKESKVL